MAESLTGRFRDSLHQPDNLPKIASSLTLVCEIPFAPSMADAENAPQVKAHRYCFSPQPEFATQSSMAYASLLLEFQEAPSPVESICAGTMTKTSDREEADQDDSFTCGTKTATAVREEQDQDPSDVSAGTRTLTEAREEDDQDPTTQAGTATSTRTREEPDQDPQVTSLFVFPRG